MGSVYRRGGATTWTVAWTQGGRQFFEHGFPDQDTAERFRALKVADVAAGRVGIPTKGHEKPRTLSELFDEWIADREDTIRSADQDRYRWRNHLAADLGDKFPNQVDVGLLKKIIGAKMKPADKGGAGLAPASVRLLMRLVSTFFSDLVDDEKAARNPAKMLPKKTRKLLKSAHDPKKVPFIEKREHVSAVFRALPEPTNIAFAISALAGLRPGEVRALKWTNVDLTGRRIHVRESVDGPTKDNDARDVPMSSTLHTLLTEWRGKRRVWFRDLVCPPMRGGTRRFLDEHTVGRHIREALAKCGLGPFDKPFYQSGRHTYASHYVMAGGSIEKLKEILGHSTVLVTERYAHLRPDLFSEADRERVAIAL